MRSAERFSARTGRILLAGVCLTGLALAAVILVAAPDRLNEVPFGWIAGIAFTFAIAAWALRLAVARSADHTFLPGRLPFALLLSKFVGLVTVLALLSLWLVGVAVGDPMRHVTGSALITGLVVCAVLGITSTGMLHLLVVYRHLTGTLESRGGRLEEDD